MRWGIRVAAEEECFEPSKRERRRRQLQSQGIRGGSQGPCPRLQRLSRLLTGRPWRVRAATSAVDPWMALVPTETDANNDVGLRYFNQNSQAELCTRDLGEISLSDDLLHQAMATDQNSYPEDIRTAVEGNEIVPGVLGDATVLQHAS
mmetsp:Transcript_26542/g.81718  ORF Transcript_26542/g.81718 Transcript_26542/m.81718 type:complete len:148 (-) Transcript_26542:130-573(-)